MAWFQYGSTNFTLNCFYEKLEGIVALVNMHELVEHRAKQIIILILNLHITEPVEEDVFMFED